VNTIKVRCRTFFSPSLHTVSSTSSSDLTLCISRGEFAKWKESKWIGRCFLCVCALSVSDEGFIYGVLKGVVGGGCCKYVMPSIATTTHVVALFLLGGWYDSNQSRTPRKPMTAFGCGMRSAGFAHFRFLSKRSQMGIGKERAKAMVKFSLNFIGRRTLPWDKRCSHHK